MLKNKDIICVAFPTWEGKYLKSTVQLMAELGKENNLLYVDYAFTYKDVFDGIRGKEVPYKRIIGLEPRLRKLPIADGKFIHVLSLPPILPVNWIKNPDTYHRLSAWSMPKVRKAIRKAMKQLNMEAPIVINAFNPFLGNHLIGQLNEKLHLYYCYDEIGAAEWTKNHGARLEAQFAPKTDGIITSSNTLHTNKKQLNTNAFVVKNGVNFELFSQKATAYPLKEYQDKYDKIIGYIGSVDHRLDYDLLEACAKNHPNLAFVFVGRINNQEGETRLKKHKNVFLLGPQSPSELHNFMQAFDLGLIPFLKNDLTAGIYPLKINEYLAAGKPVISTEFGDLDDFRDIAIIAKNPSEFVAAISAELEADSTEKQDHRIQIASQNSWAARAERFGNIINTLLQEQPKTVKI